MPTVEERIKDFNKNSLKNIIPYKYAFMNENSFRFFRGTCHLFYEDLAKAKPLPDSPLTWICGDLHIENFGSYKGNNRLVYFDLNDFDEAILAPANWELVRMITSIFVAFNSLDIQAKESENIVRLFLKTYTKLIAGGKAVYIERKTAKGIVRKFLRIAGNKKFKQILNDCTYNKNDNRFLKLIPHRHLSLDESLKNELHKHIGEWIKHNSDGLHSFEVADSVFRIAGTGSVGLNRYIFLLHNKNKKENYLLLEMKQGRSSSLMPYANIKQTKWSSEAERIVAIQKYMQNVSPALLSTTLFKDEYYVIEEMQPTADKINFELIKEEYKNLSQVINEMAILTASAQIRSTGRKGSCIADELIAFGENNSWIEAVIDYAMQYALQVKKDYNAYSMAYNKNYFSNQPIV